MASSESMLDPPSSSESSAAYLARPLIPKETNVPITKYSGGFLELDRFLAALQLKFSLDAAYYPDDFRKVQYACSHLDGKAADWFIPLSNTPTWLERTATYAGFVKLLREQFGDPNPRKTASAKIKGLRMKNSYTDYVSEFTRLQAYLNWGDAALCDLFRSGLSFKIQEKLLVREQVWEQLHPDELEPSFVKVQQMAGECDALLRAREAELHLRSEKPDGEKSNSSHGRSNATNKQSNSSSTDDSSGSRSRDGGNRSANRKRSGNKNSTSSSKDSDGSEDASGGRDLKTVKCYNCQQMGHYSTSCKNERVERAGKE